MVDLTLSEEQEMLRELAHEFANESIRPRAEHWDENSEFPMDTIAEAHEMAKLALLLSSDLLNYVVVETIISDGGYVLL